MIDWNQRLETSHVPPRRANLLPFLPYTAKRRVSVLGDYGASLPGAGGKDEWPTVFLYDEDGTCRGTDGSGAEFDLRNVA